MQHCGAVSAIGHDASTFSPSGAHPPHNSQVGLMFHPGIVTLAIPIYTDQHPGLQDVVIAHELLNLCVCNHGNLFKELMTARVPAWRRHPVVHCTIIRI